MTNQRLYYGQNYMTRVLITTITIITKITITITIIRREVDELEASSGKGSKTPVT